MSKQKKRQLCIDTYFADQNKSRPIENLDSASSINDAFSIFEREYSRSGEPFFLFEFNFINLQTTYIFCDSPILRSTNRLIGAILVLLEFSTDNFGERLKIYV